MSEKDPAVPDASAGQETGDGEQTAGFRRVFDPERWGEAQCFVRFALHSFEFDKAEAAALEGVVGHFGKAMALTRVGRRLEADREEAMTRGYSDAKRSEEFAAVVEEIFGELYACLDTMRQVLKVVYPKAQGIPGEKTSRLFSNAAGGKLDPTIPEPIRDALADADGDWLGGLRRIRTAVTHLSPGTCWPGEGGKVAYSNRALGTPSNSLELEDVWGDIDRYGDAVNNLLGTVFRELNGELKDERIVKTCGFNEDGFLYQRSVSPREAVDFHSGVCVSHGWFEEPDKPTCPMAGSCGAYARLRCGGDTGANP